MILAAHTSPPGMLTDLVRRVRERGRRGTRRGRTTGGGTPEGAVIRALCHDMRGSLTCLESALRHLGPGGIGQEELLELARAQAAHLTSMLRTAEVSGGEPPPGPTTGRSLPDVIDASLEASGLPRRQLVVELGESGGAVLVGDARLQRILVNLLENAHRHGAGAPVRLLITAAAGWVEFAVTQPGVPAARVIGHLRALEPPPQLTGLGLWSVQQQVGQLGGQIRCEEGRGGLTLRVLLPDR